MSLTFEQLFQTVLQLSEDMSLVKQHILKIETNSLPEPDQLLTVQQTAEFLRLSVPTIYGLTQKQKSHVVNGENVCTSQSKN